MRALRRYHRKHALRKYDRKHATRRYHKKAWKGKYELHLLHILSQKDKKAYSYFGLYKASMEDKMT